MTKNIIGFSGRMRSGKSALADICEKQGYKKLYFALPLKEMCAKFLNVTIDELNRLKNENIPINISLDDKSVDFFSNETDIPKEMIEEENSELWFDTLTGRGKLYFENKFVLRIILLSSFDGLI